MNLDEKRRSLASQIDDIAENLKALFEMLAFKKDLVFVISHGLPTPSFAPAAALVVSGRKLSSQDRIKRIRPLKLASGPLTTKWLVW
jgi:hypothetical protein